MKTKIENNDARSDRFDFLQGEDIKITGLSIDRHMLFAYDGIVFLGNAAKRFALR